MDKEDILFGSILSVLLIILLSLLFFVGYGMLDGINGWSCTKKYDGAKYSFQGGCKVKYKGEYIPEELYKKAFEQNLNLNIK